MGRTSSTILRSTTPAVRAAGAFASASAKVAGEGVEGPPPQTKAAAGLRRGSLFNLALRSKVVDAAGEGGNPEDEVNVKYRTLYFVALVLCA